MPFLRPENIVYSKGCTSPTHDWWCHGTFPPIRATTVSRPTRWPSWKEKIIILTEPVSFLFLIPRLFLWYQTFSYWYRPLFWDQFLWLRHWNHKKERYSRPRHIYHTLRHKHYRQEVKLPFQWAPSPFVTSMVVVVMVVFTLAPLVCSLCFHFYTRYAKVNLEFSLKVP